MMTTIGRSGRRSGSMMAITELNFATIKQPAR
jgi:hypothetical protein